jgi:hypothetical protein
MVLGPTYGMDHFKGGRPIAEDATIQSTPGLGGRTLDWIKGAAFKLVSKGGDAALEVAKAQMTTELTRVISQYLGLPSP